MFRLERVSKETPTQVFSSEFCEISKNTFFTKYLRQLLLIIKFTKATMSHSNGNEDTLDKSKSLSSTIQSSAEKITSFLASSILVGWSS